MNSQCNKILIVLGMHRSGTSAITRSLAVLGVDLGNRLIAPMPDNPKGFWEDADILDLNETLLRTFGRDHLSIDPILPEEWAAAAFGPLKSRAVQVLHEKLKTGSQVIGAKDPRFARLLPFWREVFHDAGLDVRYVIACRNPLSVAHSLRARNGIAKEKSCYLWFEHMLLSLTETIGFPRIVVDYDRLMDDPCGQLERLARWADLPFDMGSQSFIDYRDGFLDHSLRHTRFSQDDLSHADVPLPLAVENLYRLLLDLSDDKQGVDQDETLATLERLSKGWRDMAPLLQYVARCERGAQQNDAQNFVLVAQIFLSELINGHGQIYCESRSIRQTYTLDKQKKSIDMVFLMDLQPLVGLRLDFANAPVAVTLYTLTVHQADGAEIWRWCGDCSIFVNQVDMVCLTEDEGVLFLSLSNDPRCELDLSPDVLSKIQGGCYLRMELTARPLLDALPGVLSRLQAKSEASLSVPVRPQLPATAAGQLAELGELLKTVVDRKNATIETQKAEIQALQDRQNALYEQLVRAEAQLDLLKQLVLPEAGSRLERL